MADKVSAESGDTASLGLKWMISLDYAEAAFTVMPG